MTWFVVTAIGMLVAFAAVTSGKGLKGKGIWLPGGVSQTISVATGPVPTTFFLSLPPGSGAPIAPGSRLMVGSSPVWMSVTLDGEPVPITWDAKIGGPLAIPITRPQGTIVATWQQYGQLGNPVIVTTVRYATT